MKKIIYFFIASSVCNLFLIATVTAEPYLALRSNQKCSACHINPLGGGARSSFGAYYGSQVLPAKPGNQTLFDSGQITETFRLGADLRANMNISSDDSHILALARVSNERFLYTQDGNLINDFTNVRILRPKGKIVTPTTPNAAACSLFDRFGE